MADIRCSRCGKNNPDFFDVCQFCQSPLTPEAMLHIGEEPTQKDTGELEEILPEWLKDARKQGKNVEAADDAFQSQTKPKVPREEPPDLLAGLMSQADSDEDEIPDWLASINPVAEKKSPLSKPPSAEEEESSDFFAQFRQPEPQQPVPAPSEPVQADVPAWMGAEEQPSGQKDEVADWLAQPLSEPGAAFSFEDTGEALPEEENWMKDLGSFNASDQAVPPAEKEPEDLSWLHDLEASSRDDSPAPQKEAGFDFAPSSSPGEDLSWLDNLGGTSAPSVEESAPSQPASSDEDMSWLDNLGGAPAPSFEESVSSQPASSGEDMSWLDNLGGTTPAPSFEESVPSQPASSGEDMSWLDNLGGTPVPSSEESAPSQPASSDDDLGWLRDFGGTPAPEEPAPAQPVSSDDDEDSDWMSNLGAASAPAFEESAPSQPASSDEDMSWLNNLGGTPEPVAEEAAPSQPSSSQEDLDWLSNLGDASESAEPSAPAFIQDDAPQSSDVPADTSPKPFRTAPLRELVGDGPVQDTTPDWLKSAMEEPSMPPPGGVSMDWFSEHDKAAEAEPEEPAVPAQGEADSPQSAFDFSSGDSSASSAQDVDALFMEMPDWLDSETERAETSQPESAPASADDSLAPVELPSWVQAMRPVDSAISAVPASSDEQITESEGPLAGFTGVIPSSPIGSSLRPKAFSLKLQVTDEQQAGATLMEQIIAGEMTVQLHKPAGIVSSQRVLRWVLSGLFLIVLTVMLGLGFQTMPIVPSNQLSDLVATIPDTSPVLVVVDYEPAFTGELEAAAGPLLDQLALSRRSTFTFISMSPNSSALIDRLMLNTKISRPAPEGLGYQLGVQYVNLGFLPGGSSGVLGFIEDPRDEFSKFEAVILMTDNAETGRVWVEQLDAAKGRHPEIADKPVFVVSSAQSGPLLQPYVSSGQVDILVNGLYDAAKYEYVNNTRPGTVRSYWDAFGVGLMMAIVAILLGSVWSVLMRIRENRAEAEEG